MKMLEISEDEHVWHVPLLAVAENRAAYYAKKDADDGEGTYEENFKSEVELGPDGMWKIRRRKWWEIWKKITVVEKVKMIKQVVY